MFGEAITGRLRPIDDRGYLSPELRDYMRSHRLAYALYKKPYLTGSCTEVTAYNSGVADRCTGFYFQNELLVCLRIRITGESKTVRFSPAFNVPYERLVARCSKREA